MGKPLRIPRRSQYAWSAFLKYLPERGPHGGKEHLRGVPERAFRDLFLAALRQAWRKAGHGLKRQHYTKILKAAGWTGVWGDLPRQLLLKELDMSHPVLAYLNGMRALWYLILWRLAKEKLL